MELRQVCQIIYGLEHQQSTEVYQDVLRSLAKKILTIPDFKPCEVADIRRALDRIDRQAESLNLEETLATIESDELKRQLYSIDAR